jgi:hypothetical protein
MPSAKPKASSNWTKLKQKITVDSAKTDHKKRKRTDIADFVRQSAGDAEGTDGPQGDILNRLDECE